MALLGEIINKGLEIGRKIVKIERSPADIQKKELIKLLKKAKNTSFGQYFDFEGLIENITKQSTNTPFQRSFAKNIPVFSYNKIFNEWWHKTLEGEEDVCWPGKVKYFALSSGTSEASSKHIPITKDMQKAIKKAGVKQMITLKNFGLDYSDILTRGVLMLGGSTDLFKQRDYYEGDLSGILASKLPFWMQYIYKPGKKIAQTRDWNTKLEKICRKAPDWDMGYIAGSPVWMIILFEKLLAKYQLKNIHELWPNLKVFAHGGVAFEPYKATFEKLLGKPMVYIETYLASEGFLALQLHPNRPMKLLLDNGIFFEFIPFNEQNFDEEGEVKPNATSLHVGQVEENIDYAVVLNTVAGAWRYIIGDTIKFVNKKEAEIIITGRTKHYISLVGEHLSVDNMNKAVQMACEALNIKIREYAVAGIPEGSLFAHKWYVGCDDPVSEELLKQHIDSALCEINDDYKTERQAALKNVYIKVLPTRHFYGWLREQGKEGGQNKFPRVLKKSKLEHWESYLSKNGIATHIHN